MITESNYQIFQYINQLANNDNVLNAAMVFLAEPAIYVLLIGLILHWFSGKDKNRKMVLVTSISLAVSLTISKVIGHLWYQSRPFVDHDVTQLIAHTASASFPSNHATIAFVTAFSIWLFRKNEGLLWLVLAAGIAFSRVWVGVHYPLDILGGMVLGIVSALVIHAICTKWKWVSAMLDRCLLAFHQLEARIWKKKKSKANRKKRKVIAIVSASILAPIILVVGYYGASILNFGSKIQQTVEYKPLDNGLLPDQIDEEKYAIPEWEGKERVNILLIGADGRDVGDSGRSDTIMIFSIDPVTKNVSLFSILRDTYVNIPGHKKNKINSAFAFGGPTLLMGTVSELLDLPIHYYFYVELDSFIELVDAMGGVELHVEKDMKYIDTADKPEYHIDLKEGFQHLDGNKALQYVRFRKDALSDFTRTERQRKFLKAVAEQMQTTSNLVNLPTILNKISPYMETNMDLESMIKMAVLGYKVKSESISTIQIPPMKLLKEEKIKGSAVITADSERLKKYVKEQLEAPVEIIEEEKSEQ